MTHILQTEAIKTIDVLKHIYHYGSKETRGRWPILSILFIFYIGSVILEPYIYQQVIDNTLKNSGDFQTYFSDTLLPGVLLWGSIVGIGIFAYAKYQLIVWKYLNIDSGILAIELSRKFLHLPINTHIQLGSNEIQRIFDRTANGQWEIANNIINRLLIPLTILICMTILGFFTDPIMTLITLLPLPFGTWWLARTGMRLSKEQSEANNLWDGTLLRIADALSNIRILKIFSRVNHEVGNIKELYDAAIKNQLTINNGWAITESASEGFQLFVKVLVFGVGIYQVGNGSLTIGELILFLIIISRIYGPVMSLIYIYRDIIKSIANYKKGLALLAIPEERDPGKEELKEKIETIEFRKVGFSYPNTERKILSNISHTIQSGQQIAIIGHTGSGKSTIIQLLMRFYDASEGVIEINGRDIQGYSLESYRTKFAAVFQDTTLFNESIRKNLSSIRDGITEEDLVLACSQANILDFIKSLPEGFDTEVGERGLKLSGGERQRISIARAFLMNPEILILDEATSALDTKTEKLVQDAFDTLMRGRTTFVIAHRLSTIQKADTILLLEKGEILATGNHSELLKSSPLYQEMVQLQHNGLLGDENDEEDILEK